MAHAIAIVLLIFGICGAICSLVFAFAKTMMTADFTYKEILGWVATSTVLLVLADVVWRVG